MKGNRFLWCNQEWGRGQGESGARQAGGGRQAGRVGPQNYKQKRTKVRHEISAGEITTRKRSYWSQVGITTAVYPSTTW